ncbi:hypothetical protein [Halopiger aswanensis]|uniref:hypothetical protein n=1 Tax=Halopiger aswanensis TaxID=148449 RepID=UPI001474C984|nr:hypothetical protein [Halopiger aswanensis]
MFAGESELAHPRIEREVLDYVPADPPKFLRELEFDGRRLLAERERLALEGP